MGKIGAAIGTSMAGNPIGWVMGGLAVVNYFSARRQKRKMQEKMTPIAAEQLKQITGEKPSIISEYKQSADTARTVGDAAMQQMFLSREAKMKTAVSASGTTGLVHGSGNLAAENLLDAFNLSMQTQSQQTGQQVTGIQNRLAGELRALQSSALDLKSMYAQQGVKVDYTPSSVDPLKYV